MLSSLTRGSCRSLLIRSVAARLPDSCKWRCKSTSLKIVSPRWRICVVASFKEFLRRCTMRSTLTQTRRVSKSTMTNTTRISRTLLWSLQRTINSIWSIKACNMCWRWSKGSFVSKDSGWSSHLSSAKGTNQRSVSQLNRHNCLSSRAVTACRWGWSFTRAALSARRSPCRTPGKASNSSCAKSQSPSKSLNKSKSGSKCKVAATCSSIVSARTTATSLSRLSSMSG